MSGLATSKLGLFHRQEALTRLNAGDQRTTGLGDAPGTGEADAIRGTPPAPAVAKSETCSSRVT